MGTQEKLQEVKAILRSILISSGSGMALKILNKNYREEEGESIPFRAFGYSSIQDFLSNIPDTLRLYFPPNSQEPMVRQVDTAKSGHITSMISHQKKKPKPVRSTATLRPGYSALRSRIGSGSGYSRPTFNCRNNQARIRTSYQAPSQYSSATSTCRPAPTAASSATSTFRPATTAAPPSSSVYRSAPAPAPVVTTRSNIPQQPVRPAPAPTPAPAPSPAKPQQPQQQQSYYPPMSLLSQVLQRMKNSCSAGQGLKKTDILTQMKLKLDSNQVSYTLTHLNAQLNLLSNLLVVQNDGVFFKDQLSNSNSKEKEQKEEEEEEEKEVVMNVRTKIRLQKLLEQHPEGIWCSELPQLYKSEYGIDLEYLDLGFNSITEFVAAFRDVFKVVEPPNTNRLMVLSCAYKPVPKSSSTLASVYNFEDYAPKEPEPVPFKLSADVSERLFPDGVLRANETVRQHDVTALLQNEYLEVNISEIFTPSFFWITLRREKKRSKSMMADLGEFYSDVDLDKYRIPQVVLEEGLNVACTYQGQWHRGSIKKVKVDGYVVVWFYDYGTVKTYNPNNLYYLHRRFSALPAQAIACGLLNVKPIDSLTEWPRSATNKFVNKVWGVPLIAMISWVDPDTNTMIISLTDTNDDDTDVHINDWMVENRLAEFGKVMNRVPIQKLCSYDELQLKKVHEEEEYEARKRSKAAKVESSSSKNNSESNINNTNNTNSSSGLASSLATMVKDNINLSKQTNSITQRILQAAAPTPQQPKAPQAPQVKRLVNNVQSFKQPPDSGNNKSSRVCISEMSCDMQFPKKPQDKLPLVNGHDQAYEDQEDQEYEDAQENLENLKEITDNRVRQTNNLNNLNERSRVNPPLSDVNANNAKNVKNVNEDYDFNDGTLCLPTKTTKTRIEEPIKAVGKISTDKSTSIQLQSHDGSNKENVSNNKVNYPSNLNTTQAPKSSAGTLKPPPGIPALPAQPMYIIIKLSHRCDYRMLHVIHLEDQGWLCANEFVNAFTNFRDQRVFMKLLKFLNHEVDYKQVERSSEGALFSQLDRTNFEAPRSETKDHRIDSSVVLQLVPLKAALSILAKLDLLDENHVREAVPLIRQAQTTSRAEETVYAKYKNKILFDVLNVIMEYKKFRDSLKALINGKVH